MLKIPWKVRSGANVATSSLSVPDMIIFALCDYVDDRRGTRWANSELR